MADKFQGQKDGVIQAGATSVSIEVNLIDASTHQGLVGVAAASVTAGYWRQGDAAVNNISITALANLNSAYSSGGWKEASATLAAGQYRLDIPNAAFTAGADWVAITVKVAGTEIRPIVFAISTNQVQSGDSYARLGAPTGATIAEDVNRLLLDVGSTQSGTTTVIRLRSAAPTGIGNGMAMLAITSGPAAGQSCVIQTYNSSTKDVTPAAALQIAPGAGANYVVVQILPALAPDVNVVSIDGNTAAAVALKTAANAGIAKTGDAMALTIAERSNLTGVIMNYVVEGAISTVSVVQVLRAILAYVGGKVNGATNAPGVATQHVRDTEDTKDRLTYVTDEAGNRTSVTMDLT